MDQVSKVVTIFKEILATSPTVKSEDMQKYPTVRFDMIMSFHLLLSDAQIEHFGKQDEDLWECILAGC
jgi:hypothetical protein